ncbi:MAG: glycosyltransferase family 4 protein [Chloroflexota bacterium]
MKIALIIYGSLDTVSGGYLYDRKLVEHLHLNGHTVDIHSLPWRRYLEHLRDNFFSPLLRDLVTREYDLVLQDELNHPSLFRFNHTLKSFIDAPIISIVHHLRIDEPWKPFERWCYTQVEKAYLNSVDGFIFNSETTRQSVEALIDEPKPYVVGLPAGDRFANTMADIATDKSMLSGKLKLLFVGNLIPRKGLETLLNACRQLPAGKWELDIVGNPDAERAYADHCKEIVESIPRLRAAVRFYGSLSHEQLAIRYSLNHLIVVPSEYEGFGIVYLEGMGFGLPAIASTAGAAAEIIEDGQNGFLVPPSDPNALAKVIISLINDRAWLNQLSDNAQRTFDQFPKWEQTCTVIERFLLSQVETSAKQPSN